MSGIWKGTRIAPDGSDQLIWTLDESAPPYANTGVWGTADLTNNGSPTYNQDGVFLTSKSVKFPGTSNVRLYSPDSIAEIAFPVTLSCWVYISTYTYGIFVTKALATASWNTPYYNFFLSQQATTDGRWYASICVGSGTQVQLDIGGSNGNLRLISGLWNHIGLTYDGAYLRAFFNGNLAAKVAETRALYYGSNGQWSVGDHGPSGGNPLNGYVDDIRFASVARAESWFNDVYTKGWGLDGHLIEGISGASGYYDGSKYSRSLEFDATEHLGVAGPNYYESNKYSRTSEFNAESWGLPGPGFMGVTTYYEHRAWRISTGQFHFWNHTAPDPTGMFSGVLPADLLDVVIIRKFDA